MVRGPRFAGNDYSLDGLRKAATALDTTLVNLSQDAFEKLKAQCATYFAPYSSAPARLTLSANQKLSNRRGALQCFPLSAVSRIASRSHDCLLQILRLTLALATNPLQPLIDQGVVCPFK